MVVGQCFDVRDSLEALHDRFMYILISIIIIFIVDAISFNNFDLIILKRAPMSLIIYLFLVEFWLARYHVSFFPFVSRLFLWFPDTQSKCPPIRRWVCIFSTLLSRHFSRCRQREFVLTISIKSSFSWRFPLLSSPNVWLGIEIVRRN